MRAVPRRRLSVVRPPYHPLRRRRHTTKGGKKNHAEWLQAKEAERLAEVGELRHARHLLEEEDRRRQQGDAENMSNYANVRLERLKQVCLGCGLPWGVGCLGCSLPWDVGCRNFAVEAGFEPRVSGLGCLTRFALMMTSHHQRRERR